MVIYVLNMEWFQQYLTSKRESQIYSNGNYTHLILTQNVFRKKWTVSNYVEDMVSMSIWMQSKQVSILMKPVFQIQTRYWTQFHPLHVCDTEYSPLEVASAANKCFEAMGTHLQRKQGNKITLVILRSLNTQDIKQKEPYSHIRATQHSSDIFHIVTYLLRARTVEVVAR
jgi:hypothetical protein